MGTPHRGSAAAEVGDIARRAAKMLGMDTNSSILGSLSLRSSDLVRCQDVFSSLWQKYNFQVKTFQEGLPLKSPVILAQSAMIKVSETHPFQTFQDMTYSEFHHKLTSI